MIAPAATIQAAACAVLLAAAAPPAQAQTVAPSASSPVAPPIAPSWPEVKCSRYREAWTDALARKGAAGLSPDFVASHEAFLASGCTDGGHVCPRSAAELDLANVLTIRAMNAGAASTFLPFACPRP